MILTVRKVRRGTGSLTELNWPFSATLRMSGKDLNIAKLQRQRNQDIIKNSHEITSLLISVITCMCNKQSRHGLYCYD